MGKKPKKPSWDEARSQISHYYYKGLNDVGRHTVTMKNINSVPESSIEDILKMSGGKAMRKHLEKQQKRRERDIDKLTRQHLKSFKEFYDYITERYIAPDEPNPGSGKTPVQKAEERQNRPLFTDSRRARGRKIRHRHMMHKVRRGANNPSIDDIRHPELEIDSYSNTGREYDFYHKPTGISVNVHHSGHTKDGSPKYTISWDHPHPNPQMMSNKTRKVIAKNALNVVRQHILHRLPYGSVAHNTPVPNARRVKGVLRLKNTRSRMYQRLGFGPPSKEVSSAGLPDQYAKVGREPSYKQAKKGKTRLSPLHPDQV